MVALSPGPGRLDSPRSFPAFFFSGAGLRRRIAVAWLAVFLLASLACAASDHSSPHPDLAALWKNFLTLPEQRALAIAGDPRRDRWVAGASGGHDTREQAEAHALAQCAKRRGRRRMQAACLLYAIGDEIVWQGP